MQELSVDLYMQERGIMGQTISKKNIDGIEIEISFDDESYSKEETRSMIAEFIYILTAG